MPQSIDANAVSTARYDDRGRLGLGASADVRRAYDRRLSREVAMKVVRLDRSEDQRVGRRLVREATLASTLHHPGIPAVYDRDVLEDGRHFFTMRAVAGSTLMDDTIRFHQRVGPGGPGGREALRDLMVRMWEVADAVEAAHACGVIHRDLKLANVMVPYIGVAQVVDWGLAMDLASPPRRLARAGTRGYMAPEQAAALSSSLAPTVDVFAMGEMIARILYGAGHAEARPCHPTHAPPVEYAALCAQARSAEISERHAHAGELRDALAAALESADSRYRRPQRPRLAS